MGCNIVRKCSGIFAIIFEEKLDSVDKDGDKLNHLQISNVLFPPDIFPVLRSHSSNHVIEIHEKMYEQVAHPKKG